MKVAHAEQHVFGSRGLTETKAFNIRTNAHAFKLLSSGLYSDKIAAVLREIGCNAFDAHTEAGTPDRPIVVKLPNRIDNQFYIRDYGPGLSHEDVMNLYTTYFASTKQNSNDYTGAFGLGSKSPFSYTDSFTVLSVHGGIKRTYSAYLDNQGSPTISKLTESSAEADWLHGVQIGFPVKVEDFSNFQQTATKIFKWFKVTPKIEGAAAIPVTPPKFSSPDFDFYPTSGIRAGAIMGNVYYPVDMNIMKGTTGLLNFTNVISGIVLKLKIGDVQVTASREQLEYTPATIALLTEKLKKALEYIGNDIATNLRTAKTWEEKCNIRGAVGNWNTGDMYGSTWRDFFMTLGYKDATSLGGLIKNEYVECPVITGNMSYARLLVPSPYRTGIKFHRIKDGHEIWLDKFNKGQWTNSGQPLSIKLKTRTRILYGDHKLATTKVKGLFDTGQVDQVLLFTTEHEKGYQLSSVEAEARSAAAELGITNIADISTVPLPASYVNRPKRPAKKKGAGPAPLPSSMVRTVRMNDNKNLSADISKVGKEWHNFMVRTSKTGYGRTDEMRVYKENAEKDTLIRMDEWSTLWSDISIIAKQVKAPFDGYIELPAMDVKKLELVQRGWKTTYDLIQEWMNEQTTRDAVIKAAQNWKPSIDLDYSNYQTWAQGLIHFKHTSPNEFDRFETWIDKQGLLKPIELIHDASVKFKGQGRTEPVILIAYRAIASRFSLPAIVVQRTGGFISIEDFENHVKSKYPVTQTIQFAHFRQIALEHPSKAEALLKLILS